MVERDESNLNFVYNFGGLNYHLTCAEDRDIIKIAQAQLHYMQLLGGEFHIQPDDEEYEKFLILDKIYKAEQQDIKIKHVSDAKINISHV